MGTCGMITSDFLHKHEMGHYSPSQLSTCLYSLPEEQIGLLHEREGEVCGPPAPSLPHSGDPVLPTFMPEKGSTPWVAELSSRRRKNGARR